MLPVRTFLVFPKDKTDLIDQNPEVGRIAHRAFERIRDWLAAETGYTFDLRFDVVRSEKTMRELGAYVPDSPFPNIPHDDPCGQGLEWGTMLHELHKAAGITTGIQSDGTVGRLAAVVINGGGWAGGALTWHPDVDHWLDDYSKGQKVGTDIGYSVFGDWHFTYAATGKVDPCCAKQYGEAFAKEDFIFGTAHEVGHLLGMDMHYPNNTGNFVYGNKLPDLLKQQFVERNQNFLVPVNTGHTDPVEPEHPMVLSGTYKVEGMFTGTIEPA